MFNEQRIMSDGDQWSLHLQCTHNAPTMHPQRMEYRMSAGGKTCCNSCLHFQ